MPFILGEVGQLHFQHAHWNGNVKRGVDRLKVKRKMGIKNTLLQREKENFWTRKPELSNMGYQLGRRGFER